MDPSSKTNVPPVLVGVMGAIIGCISAWTFFNSGFLGGYPELDSNVVTVGMQFLWYVPGLCFGLAVAIIYFVYTKQKILTYAVGCIAISVQGLITYQIAYWITYTVVSVSVQGSDLTSGNDPTLIVAPIGAAIGGFVATFLFVFLLHMLTKKYPLDQQLRLSLYGGVLGSLLIDATFLASNVPGRMVGAFIFFIGWQTTMLVLMYLILRRESEDITAPLTPPTSPTAVGAVPVAQIQTHIMPINSAVSAPHSHLLQYVLLVVVVLALIGISLQGYLSAGFTVGDLLSNPLNPQSSQDQSYEDRPSQLPSFVDRDTYKVLSSVHSMYTYAKDKSSVYIAGTEAAYDPKAANGPYQMDKIEGADPATFDLVEDEKGSTYNAVYTRDKDHVYYGTAVVQEADPPSFVSYHFDAEHPGIDSLAKDKNHVYLRGRVIAGADPSSFQLITKNASGDQIYILQPYAKDRLYVYGAIRDDTQNISGFALLPNSDSKTFTWFPSDANSYEPAYAKDKNNVYFKGAILQGADAATFVAGYEQGSHIDARDKNHTYNYGKIVQ